MAFDRATGRSLASGALISDGTDNPPKADHSPVALDLHTEMVSTDTIENQHVTQDEFFEMTAGLDCVVIVVRRFAESGPAKRLGEDTGVEVKRVKIPSHASCEQSRNASRSLPPSMDRPTRSRPVNCFPT